MNSSLGRWMSNESVQRYLRIGLLSAGAVLASWLWQGARGFQLSDEGFLWYGAQRVMKGEVPLRDFMSYDMGRYYWSAAVMFLQHDDGIISLRAAVALFQAAGLFAGLMIIARPSGQPRSLPWLLLAVGVILVWMYPRHKLFDASVSIALVALLTFLAERPTLRRYFVAGIGVGLAAVFGRNHGVYGALGSLVVIAFLRSIPNGGPSTSRAVGAWAGGIVIGFLPIVAMAAFCPGYAEAFWSGVRFLIETKATTLPVPAPFPWRVPFERLSVEASVRGVLLGLFFIGTLVFGVGGMARIIWRARHRQPVSPPLLACIALALPYAHYAYSRADVGHLALGIFPLVLGCLVWLTERPGKWVRWSAGGAFCAASVFVMLPHHPGWQSRTHAQWSQALIGRETLLVDPATARDVTLLRTLTDRFAPNARDSFLAVPFWPGSYALLDRRSPTWEIYPLVRRSESFEREEVERLKGAAPAFVLIRDLALDGRDELRFRNTHPLLDRYLGTHFRPAKDVALPANYQVLIPRSAN